MDVTYQDNGALITGIGFFDPDQTFCCGQCFRFQKQPDGYYTGVAGNRCISVTMTQDGMFLTPCTKEDFEDFWMNYFDLEKDYEDARKCIACAPLVKTAMEYGKGIRILNQEPFETLITFIASARNNVHRIRQIVESLCARYGEQTACGRYAFPKPEALAKATEEELRALGAGYRAPFIQEASRMAVDEDWEKLKRTPYPAAKARLMQYPGVGEKVANCILLFSLGFSHAFPVDVWIRRVLEDHLQRPLKPGEGEKLGWEWFKEHGGLAQQYLFYEARQKNRSPKERR